jgi:hypothetical protein
MLLCHTSTPTKAWNFWSFIPLPLSNYLFIQWTLVHQWPTFRIHSIVFRRSPIRDFQRSLASSPPSKTTWSFGIL